MAWEVRVLDMGTVMRDPRQEWNHDGARCSSVLELVDGRETPFLHGILQNTPVEQQRLRGLAPDGFQGGMGGDPWLSPPELASFALEGVLPPFLPLCLLRFRRDK